MKIAYPPILHKLDSINLTFKQHIANYVTGNLSTSQLPSIGLAGLELGLESESLTILAGMNENDSAIEIERYFKKALVELQIPFPDRRAAAIQLIEYYADEIIMGTLKPADGLHKIIRNALGSYDFRSETKKYVMDSIGFEEIYPLYGTYDDLRGENHSRSQEKSNNALIKEVEEEIVSKIKDWRKQKAGD